MEKKMKNRKKIKIPHTAQQRNGSATNDDEPDFPKWWILNGLEKRQQFSFTVAHHLKMCLVDFGWNKRKGREGSKSRVSFSPKVHLGVWRPFRDARRLATDCKTLSC
jgi:hypothetical protein